MTFGEKAVGINFNPGGDEKVNEIKTLYARIIDLCNDLPNEGQSKFGDDLIKTAISQAVIAQMSAVKAITFIN